VLVPSRDYDGMGIALRWPAAVRTQSLPCRPALVAEVWPAGPDGTDPARRGGSLEIINVHLAAPHVPPVWRALRRRHGQVRGLVAHLDASPARRRVLLGDLNSTPLWPAYRRIAARLRDGALTAARRDGGRPPRTWGPGSGAVRLLRIDHVLVHGVTVEEVRIARIPGSDHQALVVEARLPLSESPAEGARPDLVPGARH
jgi:endonuclease/exonuclease/phosphatase family metal-dependent hydrolase